MANCCGPEGYRSMFGARFSRHLAKRYRKRGLDATASVMAAFVAAHGVRGATVLEIGGGVGDLQVELLRRGAAHTTNLELVDSYDRDAAALAAEAGVGDRMTRLRVDLARQPDAVGPHDVVVLHRVVCCYPDHERLLAAAADHATHLLVYSHPPDSLFSRTVTAMENALFRLRGMQFRTYVHDPAAMVAAAQQGGLRVVHQHRGSRWHVVGLAVPDS